MNQKLWDGNSWVGHRIVPVVPYNMEHTSTSYIAMVATLDPVQEAISESLPAIMRRVVPDSATPSGVRDGFRPRPTTWKSCIN